jgi:transketolase
MTTTITPESETALDTVAELAAQLRVDSIRSLTSAGSGHPTSSMSAADLLAVLVTRHLRYDWNDPHSPVNDHLIFSKATRPRCSIRCLRPSAWSPNRS